MVCLTPFLDRDFIVGGLACTCCLARARVARRAKASGGGASPPRRCDPLHDVAATPPRRRRDRGAAMAHNNIDESYSIDILGIYESCPSCACPVYDIDTRQGCLAA